ncbi:hypothetical protein KKC60_03275, partial [Patescibacteria group bacterium]|nr:hypothetical protein [Patescibacteria group bacterium]
PKALAYSRKIARKFGLGDCISTVEGTVSRRSNELERAVNCHTPDIVEVIGLLDYLSDSAASALIKRLSGLLHLNGGGFFFTANVAPNPEQFFLKWVIGWPMIYRTDKRLWRVVADAGVSRFQIKYEPHRIHGIVIARVNLA